MEQCKGKNTITSSPALNKTSSPALDKVNKIMAFTLGSFMSIMAILNTYSHNYRGRIEAEIIENNLENNGYTVIACQPGNDNGYARALMVDNGKYLQTECVLVEDAEKEESKEKSQDSGNASFEVYEVGDNFLGVKLYCVYDPFPETIGDSSGGVIISKKFNPESDDLLPPLVCETSISSN